MKSLFACALALSLPVLCASPSSAHFGMIIPSQPTVMEKKQATLRLDLRFWHPFANSGMNLNKPTAFQVYVDGTATNLLPTLKEGKERGLRTWFTTYTIEKPGQYAFVMAPQPYFEKEEGHFIEHHTKVYVDAFGKDEGWDKPLGLKTEIVPFARPGALYSGNVFQGLVLVDGKPVPFAEVEAEWYPGPNLRGKAPFDSMVPQTIKSDANGMFTYAAPTSGWWGFAALTEAEYQLEHDGVKKPVELGAVIWVYFHTPPMASPLSK